jgi:metal-sulfur cluster biosynthetic enzyme
MGLVLDVSVSGTPGAATVHVKLGVTEPGCMMQGIFSAAAERAIRALPGVIDVVVSIDHGYVWDPDAMTAAYRARLARVRAERTRRAELGASPP